MYDMSSALQAMTEPAISIVTECFLHRTIGWYVDPTVEECAEFIEREAASMDEKDGTRPDANRVMVWFTNRRCVA